MPFLQGGYWAPRAQDFSLRSCARSGAELKFATGTLKLWSISYTSLVDKSIPDEHRSPYLKLGSSRSRTGQEDSCTGEILQERSLENLAREG